MLLVTPVMWIRCEYYTEKIGEFRSSADAIRSTVFTFNNSVTESLKVINTSSDVSLLQIHYYGMIYFRDAKNNMNDERSQSNSVIAERRGCWIG